MRSSCRTPTLPASGIHTTSEEVFPTCCCLVSPSILLLWYCFPWIGWAIPRSSCPTIPPTRLPLSPLTTHHWNATLVVPALVAGKPENVATATPQRGLVCKPA